MTLEEKLEEALDKGKEGILNAIADLKELVEEEDYEEALELAQDLLRVITGLAVVVQTLED